MCHQHFHLHTSSSTTINTTIIMTDAVTLGQEPALVDNCSVPSAESWCPWQAAPCSAGSGACNTAHCQEEDDPEDVDRGDDDGGDGIVVLTAGSGAVGYPEVFQSG